MDVKVKKGGSPTQTQLQLNQNDTGIRKGPWTVDEDTILVSYIATHGEGHWNSVARTAGLRRSGKSCRLRWLNYLHPDVRRGNITLEEQILILELHSRWGNRWSKIARHLPGRTDNEIKNYWRTRVIKQAKQLDCDVNSKKFRDALRYVLMPRLLERVRPIVEPPNQLHPSPIEDGPFLPGSCGSATYWDSWNNEMMEQENGCDSLESLWNDESVLFFQHQLSHDLQMEMK